MRSSSVGGLPSVQPTLQTQFARSSSASSTQAAHVEPAPPADLDRASAAVAALEAKVALIDPELPGYQARLANDLREVLRTFDDAQAPESERLLPINALAKYVWQRVADRDIAKSLMTSVLNPHKMAVYAGPADWMQEASRARQYAAGGVARRFDNGVPSDPLGIKDPAELYKKVMAASTAALADLTELMDSGRAGADETLFEIKSLQESVSRLIHSCGEPGEKNLLWIASEKASSPLSIELHRLRSSLVANSLGTMRSKLQDLNKEARDLRTRGSAEFYRERLGDIAMQMAGLINKISSDPHEQLTMYIDAADSLASAAHTQLSSAACDSIKELHSSIQDQGTRDQFARLTSLYLSGNRTLIKMAVQLSEPQMDTERRKGLLRVAIELMTRDFAVDEDQFMSFQSILLRRATQAQVLQDLEAVMNEPGIQSRMGERKNVSATFTTSA